jgi:tetratricopeptide (TPR) repeat protein
MRSKFIVLVVIIVTVFMSWFYWDWTKPYDLPEVKEDYTLSQLHLDFSEEIILEEVYIENPEGSELFPTSPSKVNRENVHLVYYHAAALLREDQEDQELAIDYLLKAIELEPTNLAYSSLLRIHMAIDSRTELYIEFLDSMRNQTPEIRLQLALAYVDLLQNPDLGTAVLGQTSSASIQKLNEILEENPAYWLAYYARGLNNLYWPSGLLRTEKAIQDLGYCLAIVRKLEDDIFLPLWPLIYEAYGDALVKHGDIDAGMAVWRDGYKKYPDVISLQERFRADKEEAYGIVKRVRGIDIFQRPDPSISDISILWR